MRLCSPTPWVHHTLNSLTNGWVIVKSWTVVSGLNCGLWSGLWTEIWTEVAHGDNDGGSPEWCFLTSLLWHFLVWYSQGLASPPGPAQLFSTYLQEKWEGLVSKITCATYRVPGRREVETTYCAWVHSLKNRSRLAHLTEGDMISVPIDLYRQTTWAYDHTSTPIPISMAFELRSSCLRCKPDVSWPVGLLDL